MDWVTTGANWIDLVVPACTREEDERTLITTFLWHVTQVTIVVGEYEHRRACSCGDTRKTELYVVQEEVHSIARSGRMLLSQLSRSWI